MKRSSAFTLTELLISIAVALIMILGVNQIFKSTAATVGAGQAISSGVRDARVVQNALQDDFNKFASDAGILVIRTEQRYAFRNATDKLGDSDGKPFTLDLAGGANVSIPPQKVNNRSHRLDRIGFFTRGAYSRQTALDNSNANNTSFASPMTSSEAWVWYGHLAIPSQWLINPQQNTLDLYNPGDDKSGNTNNFYASDWVLGRVATLLAPGNLPSPVQSDPWLDGDPRFTSLDPLICNKTQTSDHSYFRLCDCPIDVAHTSIRDYIQKIANNSNIDWYNPIIGFDPTQIGKEDRSGEYWHAGSPYIPSMPSGQHRILPLFSDYASFCMTRGCSQFIVEYAGNYLHQQNDPGQPNYGQITGDGPDPDPRHKVDFIVERDAVGKIIAPARVRWYGFPRDTNGDGRINYLDVLPLRDMRLTKSPEVFERIPSTAANPLAGPNSPAIPSSVNAFPPAPPSPGAPDQPKFDYMGMPLFFGYVPPLTSVPPAYVCAWDATMIDKLPKMIRITIAIDDPNGRLADPQVFEYVFNLQQ